MKTRELILSVINDQKAKNNNKPLGLRRAVIKNLTIIENFALIITGIRRCGKSTLMQQILQKDSRNALFLNFEDIRLVGFESSDFTRLNAIIEQQNVDYLFFDEIQLVDNWEIFIHQKLNESYHVYITGSNASLLSKELGTHLTGRYLSQELFPFSYSEFLSFKELNNNIHSFDNYFQVGGMPEYVKNQTDEILQYLVNDILVRDIAVRHNIRDVNALKQLAVYLISNIGKPVSARRLTNMFGIKATSTIIEYFSYLQDTYLIDFIPVFDYSIKTQIRNPKKVYVIDLGIFNQIKITFTEDLGRQLENLTYLHLRRKYNEIYYFNKNGECDFIVMNKAIAIQCIQVCYEINDMNMEREFNGLKQALNFFNKTKGIIVTYNQSDRFEADGFEIELIPAFEFLFSEKIN